MTKVRRVELPEHKAMTERGRHHAPTPAAAVGEAPCWQARSARR
ncbi:MAG TPA: hypothetical protein VFV73_38735 [Streptosporangiaceae bacterium]|nr:hypothetical protein [Streptosporangiaceae bacterium]